MTKIQKRLAAALALVEPEKKNPDAHGAWNAARHAVAVEMVDIGKREAFLEACRFDYYKTHARPRA